MSTLMYVLASMALAWKLTSAYMGAVPRQIGEAIGQAATEKPVFQGDDGWKKTICLMVAVARYESGFRQVAGDCHGLPPGDSRCGKDGTKPTSFCFMQLHLPDGQRTKEGWTAEEVMADPLKCARAAREVLRESIKASPVDLPLLQYAGRPGPARLRFALAKRLFAALEEEDRVLSSGSGK